jgi:hypothetical protein
MAGLKKLQSVGAQELETVWLSRIEPIVDALVCELTHVVFGL